MAADTDKSPLPAWIVLPFLFAAIVAVLATWGTATWGTGSLLLGLATAGVGAASAAWWCERTLRAVDRNGCKNFRTNSVSRARLRGAAKRFHP